MLPFTSALKAARCSKTTPRFECSSPWKPHVSHCCSLTSSK